MNGIVLIDKPKGPTSAEVVRRVVRLVHTKVGHLGTLDPFATGVLPLCVGEGTKIAQFLNAAGKSYEGLIRLGAATDTGDCTGTITATAPVRRLDDAELASVAQHFIGSYEQVPPMYSALKREGVPLYKLARKGIEVERAARVVSISALKLTAAGDDTISFQVTCSKGMYVRVLAEDIAKRLDTVSHVTELRRTKFGSFDVDESVPLQDWSPEVRKGLLSVREALGSLRQVPLSEEDVESVLLGRPGVLRQLGPPSNDEPIVLVDRAGEAVAVVVSSAKGQWTYGRVLRSRPALQRKPPMLNNAR